MFTKQQLELLSTILDAAREFNPESSSTVEFFGGLEPKGLKELRGAVQSALWVSSKQLSAKDQKALDKAIAEGKVKKLEGWTMASRLAAEAALKPKHDAAAAKGGAQLLMALGIKKELA